MSKTVHFLYSALNLCEYFSIDLITTVTHFNYIELLILVLKPDVIFNGGKHISLKLFWPFFSLLFLLFTNLKIPINMPKGCIHINPFLFFFSRQPPAAQT